MMGERAAIPVEEGKAIRYAREKRGRNVMTLQRLTAQGGKNGANFSHKNKGGEGGSRNSRRARAYGR